MIAFPTSTPLAFYITTNGVSVSEIPIAVLQKKVAKWISLISIARFQQQINTKHGILYLMYNMQSQKWSDTTSQTGIITRVGIKT